MKTHYKLSMIFSLVFLLISTFCSQSLATVCDVNNNGVIDRLDITAITAARNKPANVLPGADADGDGKITVLDARKCTLSCTYANCASPPPVTQADIQVIKTVSNATPLIGSNVTFTVTVKNNGPANASGVLVTDQLPNGYTLVNATPSAGTYNSSTSVWNIGSLNNSATATLQVNATVLGSGSHTNSATLTGSTPADPNTGNNSASASITPVTPQAAIQVTPSPLPFGNVTVNTSTSQPLTISNTGTADLVVSSIAASGAPFSVFPPSSFTVAAGATRQVNIGFAPTVAGPAAGTVTIISNAANQNQVIISLSGTAVAPQGVAAISAPTAIDFGAVIEGESAARDVTITNTGTATLNLSEANLPSGAFACNPSLPLSIMPGASANITATFAPATASGGTSLAGTLELVSDGGIAHVSLNGNAVAPITHPPSQTVLSARVKNGATYDSITSASCPAVGGEVQFGSGSLASDTFIVTLTDQGGTAVNSASFNATQGAGIATFGGIAACGLKDGTIGVTITVNSLSPATGTPAAKNSSTFGSIVLDPVVPATVFSTIQVCGTAPSGSLVQIAGGASTASFQLPAGQTNFCLDISLRKNTENQLIASATDTTSGQVATAPPVKVTQVDPSSVLIAQASSRPLTTAEVETLVQNGVINLNDPSNFNVSMFTIVLTIGQFPVTISQPVVVNPTPGTTSYGSSGGGGGTGGWGGGSGGGGGGSSSQIVVIQTPTGQTIPGVIIIDGRIKTLKEFFQVTIAIQNITTQFNLTDMVAKITLPAGLSPVKAGLGTDVANINSTSAIDTVSMGMIAPSQTGTGQFIIRGDGIGTHNITVDFDGFLSGGGLPVPTPISGSAGTSVQVFGPPKLDVVVRHPGDPNSPANDVTAGEIYTLNIEITNKSQVAALYTSLQLLIGQGAKLVDQNGVDLPGSSTEVGLGHIQPGQTVSQAFRVKSLLSGKIIACQAVTSENINLTVDTGGGSCNIANTIPVNFQFPPANAPPTVMAINPLNGQPNIPITTSIMAILTPQSACLTPDTWDTIVTDWIDPTDHSKGIQVISANLVTTGTFYLEEMDAFNNPVRHIPTDLTLTTGVDGNTTIAVLRLGLASPLSQYFLKPNTAYRATLVGGANGVCNKNLPTVTLANTFQWSFSTEQTCTGIAAPVATMSQPLDGSVDRPLNQKIVLDFSNRMSPASFSYDPATPLNSSFLVLSGGTVVGGDVAGGTIVPGSAAFSGLLKTFTYTPTANLPQGSTIHVRLKNTLKDICGNSLQTPANGIKILSFGTIPPDTTPPVLPIVNPLPTLTNQASVQVSGSAEALSIITVTGGSSTATTTTSGAGLFSISVPINLNTANNLQVTAKDASNNESAAVSIDKNGAPLATVNDTTAPVIAALSIPNGATDVPRNASITVTINESINAGTVNSLNFKLEGSVVPGTFNVINPTTFSFTPSALLDYNKSYTVTMRAGGISDLAGNSLASVYVSAFSTEAFPVPSLTVLNPASGIQGTTFSVTFTGTNLATASAVMSANPGVSGSITSSSDTSVTANITIAPLAATGPTTLGLVTLGGSVTLPFTVNQKAPVITTISPNNGYPNTTVDAQITGSGLSNLSSLTIGGTAVTITQLPGGNDNLLMVRLAIVTSAAAGARTITVSTPGGNATVNFTVHAAGTISLANFEVGKDMQVNTVAIFTPAPAAGIVATITSSEAGKLLLSTNPSAVGAGSITYTMPGGTAIGDLYAQALADNSTATVTISAPGYAPVTATATLRPSGFIVTNSNFSTVVGDPDTTVTVAARTLNTSLTPITVGQIRGGFTANVPVVSSNPAIGTILTTPVAITGGSSSATTAFHPLTGGSTIISLTPPAGFSTPTSSQSITATVVGKVITLNTSMTTLLTRASYNYSLGLAAPAGPGGQVVILSASNGIITIPATVTVPEGSTSVGFTAETALATGTVNLSASAPGFTGDNRNLSIVNRNFTLTSPLVGIDRTVTATLSLDQPAPVGGATFNLSVANTTIATVTPATLTIPAGSSSSTFQLKGGVIIGFTTVSADGTANGYVSRTLNITVTDRLLDLPAAADAALGTILTVPLLIAPDAAPTDGVEITVTSSNPAIVQVLTPTVTVPAGAFQVNVQVQAAAGATGSATITANNTGFAPDVMQVTVTSGFNILESFATFGTAETDTLHLQLISGNKPFPAPAGGVQASLTSSDASCVAITSPATIAEGATFGTATISYGGTAALPCTATVTATNALFGTDTVQVTIGVTPDLGAMTLADIHHGDRRIGAGLEAPYRVTLATGNHGGVTIQIKSDNPGVALVAANSTAAGTPAIELAVPNGQSYVDFYLQGVSGATGSATLSARTTRFTKGTVNVTVVAPVLNIYGLPTSTTSLSANDQFYVRSGYLHTNGTSFQYARVSGAADLMVTLTSSTPAVGTLVTTPLTGASVTVTIAKGNYDSPSSVASGGPAFHPLSGGSTTIAATAPGANNVYSGSAIAVTVTQPAITINDSWHGDRRIGAGLEAQYSISLGGASHGGVTVRVTSSAPSVAKLSLTSTAAGTDFIDVPFANGETTKYFYLQGVSTGAATLAATQALFSDGTVNVTVVPPVLNIYGLPTSTTSLSANDQFYVRSGYLNSAGNSFQYAYVSGAADLTVTLTSSTPAVGTLVTTPLTGASVTVTIAKGNYDSPYSVASGGAAFHPLSGGSTTIAATSPGANNAYSGSAGAVTVTQPAITINDSHYGDRRIGAGLAAQYSISLGGASHGGVTVRVTSSAPSVAKVSLTSTTAGTDFIDVPFANGETTKYFYLQGVSTGAATLAATQALFSDGTVNVTVVPPVLNIYNLPTSTTSLSANSQFFVRSGYLHTNGTSFYYAPVSGAADLTVTLTSSTPAVGTLVTTPLTGASVTVTIAKGNYDSPYSVASGGAAFHPLSSGSTTIAATAPGANNAYSGSAVAVTVTQPAITITDSWQSDYRIGGGLQAPYTITLGGSAHGGVTIRVASSDTTRILLAPDGTTAGTAFIDLFIPDGQTSKGFYIQGINGVTGSVTVTATNAAFVTGSTNVGLVPGIINIYNLSSSMAVANADYQFYVRTGYLNSSGNGFLYARVSPAGPLHVLLTSSTPAVGQLKTTAVPGGAQVTVDVAVNNYDSPYTVGTGGVSFDPLAAGDTTVSASVNGFNNSWSGAAVAVTVTP